MQNNGDKFEMFLLVLNWFIVRRMPHQVRHDKDGGRNGKNSRVYRTRFAEPATP